MCLDSKIYAGELLREGQERGNEKGPDTYTGGGKDGSGHWERCKSACGWVYHALIDAPCPGMALNRTVVAILMPPSRRTSDIRAYLRFFCSAFSARPRQQYRNVLSQSTLRNDRAAHGRKDVLIRDELTQKGTRGDDAKADPDTPNVSAHDRKDLVSKELRGQYRKPLITSIRAYTYRRKRQNDHNPDRNSPCTWGPERRARLSTL